MTARRRKDPAKSKPSRKTAHCVLMAGRVLEIYADGGGYKDVEAEFGPKPKDPVTLKVMNAEALLAWAMNAYLSDEAKTLAGARIQAELERIAFANIGDYFRVNKKTGAVALDLRKVSRMKLAGVSGLDAKTGKITLAKEQALVNLAKMIGKFSEKVEHSGKIGLEELVTGSLNEKGRAKPD